MPVRKTRTLGQKLKEVRLNQGKTLNQVAEVSKLDRASIFRIEADERKDPRMTTLVGLCAALNLRMIVDGEGLVVEEIKEERPFIE